VQCDVLAPFCQNSKKFVNFHNSLLNFRLFQILAGGCIEIILHSNQSGENLLKKMPNSESTHYFLIGCWALKPLCEHTIVMYFGTMNARAFGEITVQTLMYHSLSYIPITSNYCLLKTTVLM